MATAAQIAANRANAQHSTGPRTDEGKTASSMNALKHGADAASEVIPGEDPAEYERIAADYRRDYNPQGAVEEFQVDTMIRSDWQRRRLRRIEADLYRALQAEGTTPGKVDVAILRDSATGKLLLKIWRQIAALERAHSQALAQLRKLHKESEEIIELRRVTPAPPESTNQFAAGPQLASVRNEPNFASKTGPAKELGNLALRL